MVDEQEHTDHSLHAEDSGAVSQNAPQPERQVGASPPQNIPITGRFDQYRSSYWAAAIALLPIRYFIRPVAKKLWTDKTGFLAKNLYSAAAGLFMEGVTYYFAR